MSIRVGITLGDVNGIGPEVVIKTLTDSRMWELFTPVVYGSGKVVAHYKKDMEGAEGFQYSVVDSAAQARPKRVNLVRCMDEETPLPTNASPHPLPSASTWRTWRN